MSNRGGVVLVGAGPGDADLITVKGLAQLQRADVVVHDRLVNLQLLDQVPEGCEVISVGKTPGGPATSQQRINEILLEKARLGKHVVRLKGGDPFVFGRGGEELQICLREGVSCQVVPGVSSAIAAPASIGIPVTYRKVARSCTIITGHSEDLDYDALVRLDTLIVLMGHAHLSGICRGLIEAGKSIDTPAAAVEQATTPKQRSVFSDLKSIADRVKAESLTTPLVLIIGEVVKMGNLSVAPSEIEDHELRGI
jgi:uroporphyrin-III C-methyltransferase